MHGLVPRRLVQPDLLSPRSMTRKTSVRRGTTSASVVPSGGTYLQKRAGLKLRVAD